MNSRQTYLQPLNDTKQYPLPVSDGAANEKSWYALLDTGLREQTSICMMNNSCPKQISEAQTIDQDNAILDRHRPPRGRGGRGLPTVGDAGCTSAHPGLHHQFEGVLMMNNVNETPCCRRSMRFN